MAEREFFSAVRLAMKLTKERGGLDPTKDAPAIRRIGAELGSTLAKTLESRSLQEVLSELVDVWNLQGLGELNIVSVDPLVLEIHNCYDCLGVKFGIGVPLCPFKEGLLKAILENKLGLPCEITETECCGTLSDGCHFRVKIAAASPSDNLIRQTTGVKW